MTDNDKRAANESVTVLGIDTSTASMAVAIVRDGITLDSIVSFTERNHAVRIVSEIKELLRRSGIAGSQLDLIAVGQGPGSYTGVRIAVTAAKTLCWAWNKPLVGISSLEALAFGAWDKLRLTGEANADRLAMIVPIMDARRGQVYTSRYVAGSDAGQWDKMDADGIRLIADWAPRLTEEADAAELWVVGDIAIHQATIEAAGVKAYACDMDAGAVGKLAEREFRLGRRDEVHTFVPNYTQLTEAEVKLLSATRGV